MKGYPGSAAITRRSPRREGAPTLASPPDPPTLASPPDRADR